MPNRQETNQSECAIGRTLARGILPLVVGAAICSALAGCYKPLFPPEAPRTQFETYDRMRSRYVPLEEPDVFGTPQPALRARLGRKE